MLLLEQGDLSRDDTADRHGWIASRGRRALGALLLALVLAPWFRLVAWRGSGPSIEQTLRLGRQYFIAQWIGLALGVALALWLSRWREPKRLGALWHAIRGLLLRPPAFTIGLVLGALAAALSLAIGICALNGRPLLLDGASQLVQARYFAAGRLAGPPLPDPAFWEFQFMTRTPAGWASQYPPGFALILAAGLRAGMVWLAGPVMLGLAVCLTTMVADQLFPEDRETARIGSTLVASSLFLAFHAGSYMNHSLALALVALAAFASLRAAEGTWRWALLSGAAVGALFATRPLVAVVLGSFATVLVWAHGPTRIRIGRSALTTRLAAAAGGAAPFVLAVLAYNRHLFGSPFRFGYVAVAGPAHGLGLHTDPFGNTYGVLEALGYTSADLLSLSLDLLQTPLPILILIGWYLVQAPRLTRGMRLAASWALLPVVANAMYWHHDLFMGPRLLYESAPGWSLLAAGAALHMIRALPEASWDARGRPVRPLTRPAVALTFALAIVVGIGVSGLARVRSYAATGRESGATLAAPAADRPALVFVHEDWQSRLGARLATLGAPLDSIRAALLANTTCELEQLVTARERSGSETVAGSQANLPPASRRPPAALLRDLRMPSGASIRTYTGEVLSPECEREGASDFAGVLALAPLLWQGDLPGIEGHGAMYVRDLGPERNARLVRRFPERQPAVLVRIGRDQLRLVPYERGIKAIWKSD